MQKKVHWLSPGWIQILRFVVGQNKEHSASVDFFVSQSEDPDQELTYSFFILSAAQAGETNYQWSIKELVTISHIHGTLTSWHRLSISYWSLIGQMSLREECSPPTKEQDRPYRHFYYRLFADTVAKTAQESKPYSFKSLQRRNRVVWIWFGCLFSRFKFD